MEDENIGLIDPVKKWDDIVVKGAERFRIDANLIRAIILTESSGDEKATRFEHKWRWFVNPTLYAEKIGIEREKEEILQATSFGLMQVMGAVARELGFTDDLFMLLHAEIGIFYGCKKLRQLFDKYGNEEDVVSAYNQGNNRMDNGQYCNMRYVDRVFGHLRNYRKLS